MPSLPNKTSTATKDRPPGPVLISLFRVWWNAEAHYAFELAAGLHAQGIKVLALGWAGSPFIKKCTAFGIEPVPNLPKPNSPWTVFFTLFHCSIFVKSGGKLIISFTSPENFCLYWLKKLQRHYYWVKVKANASSTKKNWANRRIYGAIDRMVAVSPNTQRDLQQLRPAAKTEVIYFGTAPLIPSGYPLAKIKQELKLVDNDKPILGLIGRAQPVKGHRDLLKAFQPYAQDAYLVFLIKDLSEYPEEVAWLKTYIVQNKLEKAVQICGFQSNLADFYTILSLGVIPSLASEEIARVWVELMAAGVPSLAYPTGALPSLIRHGENGWLCSQPNTNTLSAQIGLWLEENKRPANMDRMRLAIRAEYQEKFSQQRFRQSWQNLLTFH